MGPQAGTRCEADGRSGECRALAVAVPASLGGDAAASRTGGPSQLSRSTARQRTPIPFLAIPRGRIAPSASCCLGTGLRLLHPVSFRHLMAILMAGTPRSRRSREDLAAPPTGETSCFLTTVLFMTTQSLSCVSVRRQWPGRVPQRGTPRHAEA